jgi:hypothetical protein
MYRCRTAPEDDDDERSVLVATVLDSVEQDDPVRLGANR